jgi:MYXO-CTERM domain-containing protein
MSRSVPLFFVATLLAWSQPVLALAANDDLVIGQLGSRAVDTIDALTRTRGAGSIRFALPSGETIAVVPAEAHFEGENLALTGDQGSGPTTENVQFLVKSNGGRFYAWLVARDRNLAFEYRTDRFGEIVATQVAVEKIFPVCNLDHSSWPASPENFAILPPRSSRGGPEAHIGEYDGQDLFKLESHPGAKKVIYLDITDEMNGDTPINFDKSELWKSWQAVASGFSMFDVNVTTNADVYAKAGVTNSGIAKYLNEDGRAFANLNSFGTTDYAHVFTTPSSEAEKGYGVGRTALHELGHVMGLSHDGGGTGGEYYEGTEAVRWCPIMGNYYIGGAKWGGDALYQWSLGEYNTASQQEDDLAIITENLPFKEDDIASEVALVIKSGKVEAQSNRGFIGGNQDSDSFAFEIGDEGGKVSLVVDRTEYLGGAMLDVYAAIKSADGDVLVEDNPQAKRSATLEHDLEAGSYTLEIRGGAELTPQTGFSDYSSMGFYAIEGTIEGAVEGGDDDDDETSTGSETETDGESSESSGDDSESDGESSTSSESDETDASDDDDDDDDDVESTSDGESSDDEEQTEDSSEASEESESGDDDDDDDDDSDDADDDGGKGSGCSSTPGKSGVVAGVLAMFVLGLWRRRRT